MLISDTPTALQELREFTNGLRSGAIRISSYREYRAAANALQDKLRAAERVSCAWTQPEQQEMRQLYREADDLIFGAENGVAAATMAFWDFKSFVEDGDLQADAKLAPQAAE